MSSSVVGTAGRLGFGVVALCLAFGAPGSAAAAPDGQVTWGVHITLAPTWFDPAETTGIITPYMLLYAMHDALVKPMPGNALAPGLAESWSEPEDGMPYQFVLPPALTFHHRDPLTSED